jgi:uncharacterized protein YdaU (DUF1376 family)
MPLWVADFVGDTLDLDAKEIGAYMLILMTMWGRDGYLPHDEKKLQRVARCGRDWPRVWASIRHYFTVDGDKITQDRLAKELQKVASKREVNAQHGARGGKAKALKNNNAALANAIVSLKQPEPEPEESKREANASPKTKRGSRLSPDWFLPMEWGEWAVSQGLDPGTIRSEADRFRDYWCAKPGQHGVKLDWQATWRNWIRSAKDRGNANRNARQIPQGGKRADPALEQILRLTGLSQASVNGRGGTGSLGEEDGSFRLGS